MSLRDARARTHDHRAAVRAAATLAAALVAIGVVPLAATPAHADGHEPAPGTEAVPVAETTLLEDPARGGAALRELGSELPVAAERNDLEPTELRALLLEDRTVWLDVRGRVHFIDPAPTSAVVRQAVRDSEAAPLALAAPLSRTFALHSKPGSTRTIYLDVDGAGTGGTHWASQYAVAGSQPGWDPAGNGSYFNAEERERLQKVWAMVAEDFAAYDVDVTTEDPGTAALVRSSGGDSRFGTRVVISPSDAMFAKVCNRGCAGAAYRGYFGIADRQPVWVFPHALGNDPKLVAEAVSHEVGHNLGLGHDGDPGHEYHAGSAGWAPIMGVGYYEPITQWSRGEYAGATNSQDDLAIIGHHLRRRTDESSPSAPAALSAGHGVITSGSDIDVVRLGSCPAGARIQVTPAAISPNLDVSATLRDASGTVRASAAPVTSRVDRESAAGMGAALRVPATGRNWQVSIRGEASSGVGYSSYASIGAYTFTAPGCDGGTTGIPSPARAVSASADVDQPQVTVRWSPPTSSGAGPVTEYVVRVSGTGSDTGRTLRLPATARRHTITGLSLDTEYDVLVSAINKRGASRASAVDVVTARLATSAPSAPRSVRARWNDATRKAEIFWAPPSDDGGLAVTGYRVALASGFAAVLPADDIAAALSDIHHPGKYVATVQALNAAGTSTPVQVVVVVPPRPGNDDIDRAQRLAGAAGRVEGDTTGATGSRDDPAVIGDDATGDRHSVWYSWTATHTGVARFATGAASPTRDTVLAVYTGRDRDSLVRRAANDDTAGTHLSAVRLPVSAGTTYRILVDGPATAGGCGAFDLTWVSGATPARVGQPNLRTDGRNLEVRWPAARDGGAALTQYRVLVSGQKQRTVAAGTRKALYRGLAPGRYQVRVVASSVLGSSPASAPATIRVG